MFWHILLVITIGLPQVLFLWQVINNYRYSLKKYKKQRSLYLPKTILIVPCRGLDTNFYQNIQSFYNQDYPTYGLWFVVADQTDAAYRPLCELKQEYAQDSAAYDVRILVAGPAQSCGQKVHNMLHAVQQVDQTVEVLAFADADVCVRPDWLRHMVHVLANEKHGAASGYRWYVPKQNNLATLMLTAINARVVQALGNSRFNQAWGGSMAIRRQTFHQIGLARIWSRAISDDYTLSRTVKNAGKKIAFVPACLTASLETMTWRQLFEFVQRQLIITRIYAPGTWWFALGSSLYVVLGLWASGLYALFSQGPSSVRLLWAMVCCLLFICQMSRAILRQVLALRLLKPFRSQMIPAMLTDIFLFPLGSVLFLCGILASTFKRTIIWRGIRYKLISLTETIVLGTDQ